MVMEASSRRRLISNLDGISHCVGDSTSPVSWKSFGSAGRTCHSCPKSLNSSMLVTPSRPSFSPVENDPIIPTLVPKFSFVALSISTRTIAFQVVITIASSPPRLIVYCVDFSFFFSISTAYLPDSATASLSAPFSPFIQNPLGDDEGDEDGDALGLPLGDPLGLDDGEELGEPEGEELGDDLGDTLGDALGLDDGDALGELEGDPLGDDEGLDDGEELGDPDGDDEGDPLGDDEGDDVGEALGDTLGDALGLDDGDALGELEGDP